MASLSPGIRGAIRKGREEDECLAPRGLDGDIQLVKVRGASLQCKCRPTLIVMVCAARQLAFLMISNREVLGEKSSGPA